MKKAILLQTIMLLFVAAVAVAQPYESCFGKVSTKQNVLNGAVGPVHTTIREYSIDTININNVEYFSFREDTITGKLWKLVSFGDQYNVEVLMMDLSLEVGDSINLGFNEYAKIEEIYYDSQNRKVQRTNRTFEIWSIPGYVSLTTPIMFIEGIGPNTGLEFPVWWDSPFLLCAYKDGVQVYANSELDGMCEYYEAGIDDQTTSASLQITNTQTEVQINWEAVFSGQVQVLDTQGLVRYEYNIVNGESYTVNITDLSVGIYLVRLITNEGELYGVKKIVKY